MTTTTAPGYDNLVYETIKARLAPWHVEDDREKAAKDAALPYVLLELPPMLMGTDRWSSLDFVGDATFQVTCVAESRRAAIALNDAVVALLADWVPVVEGWHVWPVGMNGMLPRLNPPYRGIPDRVLVEAITQWKWHATRNTTWTPGRNE